jgi:hypothetical protein
MLKECCLHWMKIVRLTDAFDGRDLIRLVHGCERQTGIDAPAIDMHRASAALAMVTAFLRSGQMQGLPQTVEQGRARLDLYMMFLSVHPQCDRRCPRHFGGVSTCSCFSSAVCASPTKELAVAAAPAAPSRDRNDAEDPASFRESRTCRPRPGGLRRPVLLLPYL